LRGERRRHLHARSLAALEIPLGNELVVCQGHGVPRHPELNGERPARREKGTRPEAAIEHRLADAAIELPEEREIPVWGQIDEQSGKPGWMA
jgi:hypothetical protein